MKIALHNPTKGMYTAVDQPDLPKGEGHADLIENYYLDRFGKLRKRDGTLEVSTNLDALGVTNIRGMLRFIDDRLSSDAEWIAVVYDASAEMRVYTSTDGLTWAQQIGITPKEAIAITSWTVINGVLRLAHGLTLQRWYGYIDVDDFFHNQYDPTDAWTWDTRQPRYPTTWTYAALTNVDPSDQLVNLFVGGGSLIPGFYRYKVVPVFDGIQEALFAADNISIEIPDASQKSMTMLQMTFDTDDWNNRIQSLNIYRAYSEDTDRSEDAAYQLSDSISTRNDPAVESLTDVRTMEDRAYLPDEAFGVDDYIFSGTGTIGSPNVSDIKYGLTLGDNLLALEGDVLSNTATVIITTSDVWELSKYANVAWTLKKYVCTSGGTWTGATTTTEDSGTNGWGGIRVWLSDADADANYANGDLVGRIIEYDTAGTAKYGVITHNHKLVLALSVGVISANPAKGSALTVNFGNVMWTVAATVVTMYWCDYGRADKGAHQLDGVTSITAAARYNVIWKGRMYGQYVKVTKADASTETLASAVAYTEVGQFDVYPADFLIQPDTDRGGIGQGVEVIEEADMLALFYRADVEFLKVPHPDPQSWDKWSSGKGIGLVAPLAKAKTPVGVFFCSDDGIYLINHTGSIVGPVSLPIQDSYLTAVASSSSSFTATYYPQQRQVWFSFGLTYQAWVLDIDSYRTFPRWSKYIWGSGRAITLGAPDENNILYLFDRLNEAIHKIGNSITGDEASVTTFRSSYIKPGTAERLNLIRRVIITHKGTLAITPTIYLNNGASSQAKTAIAASANGIEKKVNIKRRVRNFAIQLATAASTAIVHEISDIEIEVEDERE